MFVCGEVYTTVAVVPQECSGQCVGVSMNSFMTTSTWKKAAPYGLPRGPIYCMCRVKKTVIHITSQPENWLSEGSIYLLKPMCSAYSRWTESLGSNIAVFLTMYPIGSISGLVYVLKCLRMESLFTWTQVLLCYFTGKLWVSKHQKLWL